MRRCSIVVGILCLALALFAVGCSLLNPSDAGIAVLTDTRPTGPADVKFRIIVPPSGTTGLTARSSVVEPAIRAAVVAQVTFRLILVNIGNSANPTTTLTRTATVDGSGTAQVTFSGIPSQTAIGEISIASGSLAGYTDFHGASDLGAGANIMDLAPKGSGIKADIIANVLSSIVNNTTLMKQTIQNLASRIESVSAALIASPTPGICNDVFDTFVRDAVPATTYTRLSISDDRLTLKATGLASWTRTISDIIGNNGTGGKVYQFRRILKQGLGTFAYVSWEPTDSTQFGIARIDVTNGLVLGTVVNAGHCREMMVLPDDSILVGGTLSGLPLLFRWNGIDTSSIAAGAANAFNKSWAHSFTELTVDSTLPAPEVEYLEYVRSEGLPRVLTVVRDPVSRLTRTFTIDATNGNAYAVTAPVVFTAWATPGNAVNTIGWDMLPGISTYTVYWALSENLTVASYAGRISATQSPIVHDSLRNDVLYYYIVTNTNAQGAESTPSAKVRATPRQPVVLAELAGLFAGGNVSFGIKKDGTLWGWGQNTYGDLGIGTVSTVLTPVQVSLLTNIRSIAARNRVELAVRGDGSVWTWGNGNPLPAMIAALASGVVQASTSGYTHFVVKSDGSVWAWGSNFNGQFGDGTTPAGGIGSPIRIASLTGILAAAAGGDFGVFLRDDGTVVTSGLNTSGQLGIATSTSSAWPVQVYNLSGVVAIGAGSRTGYALKSDGTVWAWGDNGSGMLGDGTKTSRNAPVQVSGLSGIKAIAISEFAGYALKSDGTVWQWGNIFGSSDSVTTPTAVASLTNITTIAAGTDHAVAMKSDGSIYAWGRNYEGQYGDGTTTISATPVAVKFGTPQAPIKPYNVKTYPMTNRNIISFDAVSGTAYNLYWSTSSTVTPSTGTKIGNITSPYAHRGLTNSQTYWYVVTAVNAGGESAPSDPASSTPAILVSTKDGAWSDGSAWTSGQAPQADDSVEVRHRISLDGNATCTTLFVATGSLLVVNSYYGPSGKLVVLGDTTNEGGIYLERGYWADQIIELRGNLIQRNYIDPGQLWFTGSADQYITMGPNANMSRGFLVRKSGGVLKAASDLWFSGLTIDFVDTTATGTLSLNGKALNCTSGLVVRNGQLTDVASLSAPSNRYEYLNVRVVKAPVGGTLQINGNVAFEGDTVLEGNVLLASGASLMNPGYQYNGGASRLRFRNTFTNRGSVYCSGGDGPPSIDVTLEGDLNQEGYWAPNSTTFTGSNSKISLLAGKTLNTPISVAAAGATLQSTTDLAFDSSSYFWNTGGTGITFTNTSASGTLDMSGNGIRNSGAGLWITNGKVIGIASLTSPSGRYTWVRIASLAAPVGGALTINGEVALQGDSSIEGSVIVASGAAMTNPGYQYNGGLSNVTFKGALTNNGTMFVNAGDGPPLLYITLEGSFAQNGTYTPTATYFNGASAQTLSLGAGKILTGKFYENVSSGTILAGSDLVFDTADLYLSPTASSTGTLDMQSRTLKVQGGFWNVLGNHAALNVERGRVTGIATLNMGGDAVSGPVLIGPTFGAAAGSSMTIQGYLRLGGIMHIDSDLTLPTGCGICNNTGGMGGATTLYIDGVNFVNQGSIFFTDSDYRQPFFVYHRGTKLYPTTP
ncbi:MAG: hypothetical protein HQM09_17255 [Candidatus Riflebacteria bacterium]|nr:hypothetical protein [Candidatus Riflebacteria bacterium]